VTSSSGMEWTLVNSENKTYNKQVLQSQIYLTLIFLVTFILLTLR